MEDVIILLVIGWIVKSVFRIVTEADIRKQQFRAAYPPPTVAPPSTSEIEQLRAEIAHLRETTTLHAMSLQHAVERLDHRVEFMERKSIDDAQARPQSPQQLVGR